MLLKNCTVDGANTDIQIDDGKIKKVGQGLAGAEAIDLAGRHVLPGIIDPHVHFREPGMTHKEDFYTGSCAAARGGVTTFLDMPNTVPPTTTVALLEEKRKLAQKSIVNFGFHFGGTDNISEIKRAKNIASVKVFMNISTGKLMIKDDDVLRRIFSSAKLVTVHAEGEMVDKAIAIAKECGCRLYLCHISQRSELDVIRKEKTKSIYAEVTPHHLFLSEHDVQDGFQKMKPELKSVLDNEALLSAINDGLIDTIGTDHAPHTVGEKMQEEYPYGVPGIETMFPLLLDAVNHGQLTLAHVQKLCCESPARIFGIKNKGFIKPGFDADLVIIDMDEVREVSEEEILSRSGWSPFSGRSLKGWPIMTIVGGNIVFDGEIHDNKGREVEYE